MQPDNDDTRTICDTKKKTIAVLSSFPVWRLTCEVPAFHGHYDVWLMALHEALENQDEFDIHWVTLCKEIKAPLGFESRGQKFHVLPRNKRTIGLFTLYAQDRIRMARELALIKPDLVHSWGTEDCYGLCARDFNGAKLHSVQGAMKAYVSYVRFPLFVRIHSMYEPWVWRGIRHITTESPWCAQRVRDIAPRANPILWEYAVEERFFQIERNLTSSPQCLYVGNDTSLNPLKNVEFLIEAFSDQRMSRITLKLAGVSTEQRPDLPANIIALGQVGREELADLYAESWALVHMSLADTGPTVVKEARVAGLPVILSNRCGSVQHVEDGKSGFILAPNDKEGFIRSVLAVTRDAGTSLAMGRHGRERCREALGKEKMIDTLLHLYRTIPAEPAHE